jgi:hypothetical protein
MWSYGLPNYFWHFNASIERLRMSTVQETRKEIAAQIKLINWLSQNPDITLPQLQLTEQKLREIVSDLQMKS